MPARTSAESRKNIAYLSDRSITDLQKLQRGAARFPNPEETIRPLFEFADLLKEDLESGSDEAVAHLFLDLFQTFELEADRASRFRYGHAAGHVLVHQHFEARAKLFVEIGPSK